MAITISGENNNDRILAQDGVIDEISGINIVGLLTAGHINVGSNIQLGNAGIVTATTFIGNLTGNVNSTSPLLLQTGGSERFRITGNNELGIAGANYGSSGQVLTSGGSGSAVTWSAIPTQVTISNNADNRVITGGSGVNLNGESLLTFDGNKLLVASDSYNILELRADENNDGGNDDSMINFTHDGTKRAEIRYDESASTLELSTSDNRNDLVINSSGYVGVKRSTPLANLHVANNELAIGDNPASAAAPNATYDGLVVDGSNASFINIRSRGSGGASYGRVAFSDDVRSRGYVEYRHEDGSNDDQLRFATASTVQLIIDSSGRVLIGTTTEGEVTADNLTIADSGNCGITIRSGTSAEGNIFFSDGTSGDAEYRAIVRYEHNNDAFVIKTTGSDRLRITSGGDVLIADTTNSLYNDTSGGGMNLKAAGQLVVAKQANSVADPLIWLNDTGQTTNRTILLAQDGSEKGHIGLLGNSLTLGVSGGHLVQIVPAYGASYPTSRGSVRLGGGNATNGFPLIGYNNSGTRIATHVCTGSFYNSTGMIIIKTTLPKHNTGYTMWSCRITGYAYSTNEGGAIDCVVGCYTGENNYYNPTVTGTYPTTWRDHISFATITTGDHNDQLCIRLGQTSTTQLCEIAVTDFVWGYSSVSDVMAEGWSMVCLTSDSGYNSQVVSAIQRSKEIYNDEFQVLGANSGELLTNRPGRGGTIMGTYQYTQYNQGQNYEHLIRSPHGHTDLTDQYCDSNWSALISASVDGTSTVDTGTTYFCQDNSDDNNSLQITNKFGYSGSSGSSNRIYMVINSGRVAWKMDHPGGYRVSVTVQFLVGGKKNGTYNTTDTAYQSN